MAATFSQGFPQGSGLSPLLFDINGRKLQKTCICDAQFQFADDTTLAAEQILTSVYTHCCHCQL